MVDFQDVSDEDLNRPGPGSLADELAAKELGLDMQELVRIMDTWSGYAGAVARERRKRLMIGSVASPNRTVIR